MSLISTRRFVTVAVAAVAASYLSGGTSMAQGAQEQRAATCSPNPIPVGPSANNRPHVYKGPDKISTPTRIVYVRPEYPQTARAAKVQGVVILEVQVERDGHVCNARVLRSIPLLDRAAIDAVLRWRFTPVAVPVIMTMTVNFRLEQTSLDGPPW